MEIHAQLGLGQTLSTMVSFDFFSSVGVDLFERYIPLTHAIMLTFVSFSLHSVNTIFTGANTIYEVSVQHHLCLFESVNRVMLCVAHIISLLSMLFCFVQRANITDGN
jgi:hypothetical protein